MHIYIGNDVSVYEGEFVSVFYFEINDFIFPNIEWSDFVYPVLCNWANELLNHQNSSRARYILFYLTGPYRIEVHQNETKMLDIKFVRDGKCVHFAQISYYKFLEILFVALKKARSLLYENQLVERTEFEHTNRHINDCMRALKRVFDS